MSVSLKDLNDSPYLVSDEFTVGTVFPPLEISAVKVEGVPTPGKKDRKNKAIIYFKGAKKAWCANKTELRKLARIFGATDNIDRAWIGAKVSLVVVGNVRRPDNTYGNAIRVKDAIPPGGSAPIADPGPSTVTATPEEEEERRIADAEKAKESAGEQ